MKIDVTTKYDVGDTLFPLVEVECYNDYYRNETYYRPLDKEFLEDSRRSDVPTPLKVESIKVTDTLAIWYLIRETWFKESSLFKTYEEALEKARELNARNEHAHEYYKPQVN